MRVIIIGAGIGGLTTANALRAAGHDVEVYERAEEPREVGAGIGLWPNAVTALRRIGLGEVVLSRGEAMQVAEVLSSEGRRLNRFTGADFKRLGGDVLALVHRAELLEELLRPLPEGVVRFGHTFQRFEQSPSGVAARFAGSSDTATADLLIAADGLNSTARAQMRGCEPPRYSGYSCWRGIVQFPEASVQPGYVGEVWGFGARFGITRIGGGRIYWWATLNAPPSPHAQGQLDAAAKETLLRSHGGFCDPVPAIIDATDPDYIIRNDIYDRPPIREWSDGRVLLIGDAAHPTTPNLGQGGCMAIEDGVRLPRFLEGCDGKDAVSLGARLRDFTKHRYAKTASVVRQSRWIGAIGQWEYLGLCWGRNVAMRATTNISFRRMMRTIGRFEG